MIDVSLALAAQDMALINGPPGTDASVKSQGKKAYINMHGPPGTGLRSHCMHARASAQNIHTSAQM